MPIGFWSYDDPECFGEASQIGWNHSSHLPISFVFSTRVCGQPWAAVPQLQNNYHALSEYTALRSNRGRRIANPGSFGFPSAVRKDFVIPPLDHNRGVEPIPFLQEKKKPRRHFNTWQAEHLKLTSKHLLDRVPLPEKGKPVARRGRKATDQISDLTAGLPEEE